MKVTQIVNILILFAALTLIVLVILNVTHNKNANRILTYTTTQQNKIGEETEMSAEDILLQQQDDKQLIEEEDFFDKYTTQSGKETQFVFLALDGSRSLNMWKQTRQFAHEVRDSDIELDFTYFVSGVYFIPSSEKLDYHLTGYSPGESVIGFGGSKEEVAKRIEQVNLAFGEGHEIGSHVNGHFDGTPWSKLVWDEEFDYFNEFFFERNPSIEVPRESMIGFRAPVLGHSADTLKALSENGYTYDTSGVSARQDVWPTKSPEVIWQFKLGPITLDGKNTLAMDYNAYMVQSGAKDTLVRGTREWDKAYRDLMTSYMQYFNNNYNGDRGPVHIGHHFSLWNDGLYWEVMKDFARDVCGRDEVICGTYSELVEYMEHREA